MGRGGGRRAEAEEPPAVPDGDESAQGDEGSAEEPEEVEVAWVVGQLATVWDEDKAIRARARATKMLTRWPAPKSKGIPSMKAINLCCDPLYHLAKRWCPLFKEPKSPPVPLLRAEAPRCKTCFRIFFASCCTYTPYIPQILEFRRIMGFEEDEVLVYLDSWGLRRLFSLAIRRRSSARKRRDPVTDQFFNVLVQHWGHLKNKHKKKGGKGADPETEESEELAEIDAVIDSEVDGEDLSGLHLQRDGYEVLQPAEEAGDVGGCHLEEASEKKLTTPKEHKFWDPSEVDGDDLDLKEQAMLEKIAMLKTPTPRNLAAALDAQATPPKTSPPHAPEVVRADSAACKPEGEEQLDILNNQAYIKRTDQTAVARLPEEADPDPVPEEKKKRKKCKVTKQKASPASSLGAPDNFWDFWDEETEREYYRFKGWTEDELRAWYGDHDDDAQPSKPLKRMRVFRKSSSAGFDNDGPLEAPAAKAACVKDKDEKSGMEEDLPEKEDEDEETKETCFARRPPPKKASTYMKWKAVKSAFLDHVGLYVNFPSKYQDPFWKECQVIFKARADRLKTSEDYVAAAVKAAKRFVRNLPAL
ncbi:unnamed protein product [Symbiodinium sp. CCMP2592]|nr:unnamed protein product [Symbiodinium sp. CCMP2592]